MHVCLFSGRASAHKRALCVRQVIYTSFGGSSKGLHFNNLTVGLVLLTRGRDEEKAKCKFSGAKSVLTLFPFFFFSSCMVRWSVMQRLKGMACTQVWSFSVSACVRTVENSSATGFPAGVQ